MRLVVMAYQDVGWVCLDELLALGADIALVVSHRDDPGEKVWFGSVAHLARGLGLNTLEDPGPAELRRRLQDLKPDFIFSFYYRRMLPAEWLALAGRGAAVG